MNSSGAEPQPSPHYRGPIVSLLLLAPLISEVIYGATRLSTIFVLVPEILTWGCAALLIREFVRRWNKGWPSMLLLGLALAVAEEWIIQQTSIAPLIGLAKTAYGRVWGVNLVYFLWALGYESVWVVLILDSAYRTALSHAASQPVVANARADPHEYCIPVGGIHGVVWMDATSTHHDLPHAALHPASVLSPGRICNHCRAGIRRIYLSFVVFAKGYSSIAVDRPYRSHTAWNSLGGICSLRIWLLPCNSIPICASRRNCMVHSDLQPFRALDILPALE